MQNYNWFRIWLLQGNMLLFYLLMGEIKVTNIPTYPLVKTKEYGGYKSAWIFQLLEQMK